MEDKVTAIFGELSQLSQQYKKEVPGGRRAWPNCIKERVVELRELGVRIPTIAKRSGIPYYTVHSWTKQEKPERPSFVPVKVVSERRRKGSATVTVAEKRAERVSQVATVTVTTPIGYKIEGIPLELALELFASGGVR